MKVRYKGVKPKMPVCLPIGAKSKHMIREIRFADPYVDLSDADALELVRRAPEQYEIVAEEKAGLEIHEEAPKKPGRPKKVTLAQ